MHWKRIATASTDLHHRNIAQEEEEADPRSRTLAAAEGVHSDRIHTVELVGHTRIQAAGTDRHFAADTVRRPVEVGNPAATGFEAAAVVARTWAPVGKLAVVRTGSAVGTVGPVVVGGSD